MFVFVIILSLAASSTAFWPERNSAASEAQIRFAEENKYDSTGPGAKTPEYAYRTYQTLEEALVAYANDPDTQLPEYEKNRALYNLVKPSYYSHPEAAPVKRYQPKTVSEYTGYKRPENDFNNAVYPLRNTFDFRGNDFGLIKNVRPKEADYRFQKYQVIRGSPLDLGHYKRPQEHYSLPDSLQNFEANPQYTFSYGVHLTENTFKNYYYPENHDEPSDEDEGTLAFKIKKAISKRPNNIDGFFEKRKKKKVAKKSSSVGKATAQGVAYISTNEDDGAYASHLIKIEVYDMEKIRNIAPTEQWKHADVRVKYYATSEEDNHVQSAKDVIFNITKQLASKSDCVNYVIDGNQ